MSLSRQERHFIDHQLALNNEFGENAVANYFERCSIEVKENIVDYLLNKPLGIPFQFDLEEQDEEGNTLLHFAIRNNHEKTVIFLLASDNIEINIVKEGLASLTEITNFLGKTPVNTLSRRPSPTLIQAIDDCQGSSSEVQCSRTRFGTTNPFRLCRAKLNSLILFRNTVDYSKTENRWHT